LAYILPPICREVPFGGICIKILYDGSPRRRNQSCQILEKSPFSLWYWIFTDDTATQFRLLTCCCYYYFIM